MSAVAFDTHAAVKKLTGAGFSEQQAEIQIAVLVEAITGEFATQHDLKEMETVLTQDIAALRQEITELRPSTEKMGMTLRQGITALRPDTEKMGTPERCIETSYNELKHEIEMLRTEMKTMETRLTIRIGALVTVGPTALGVLMKIL